MLALNNCGAAVGGRVPEIDPAVSAGLRRKLLRRALVPLTDLLSEHRSLVSLRQLWAEGFATLELAGDCEAGDRARAMFNELITECPWFPAALVQAAYLAHRDRDLARAKALLRQAEDIAPFHHHVKEARRVILSR